MKTNIRKEQMFGLSKIAIYFIVAGFMTTTLTGGYFMWKHNIRAQALMEFNQKQMEQVIEDQKKFNEQLSQINQNQQQILDDMKRKNEEIDRRLGDLNGYLSSDQARRESRPSSEVLKRTFRQLSGK